MNSVVGVILLICCLGGATQATPTTRPCSEAELAVRDRFFTLLPSGQGYVHGVKRVSVPQMALSHTLELSSSKLAIVVDGWLDVDLTRSFFHSKFMAARKETISGSTTDGLVRISMTPARPGIHVLDNIFEPGQGKISVDKSWIEPIKREQGNELNSFEFVVSMTRKAIMDKPWPESAKSLAIWETYAQDLIASGDRIKRFDCGSVVAYVSVRGGGKSVMASGKIFATANSRWLGDIWMIFESRNNNEAYVAELLSRVKFLGD